MRRFQVLAYWYDFEIDHYIFPIPNLAHPELLICGGDNAAATITDNNGITFCPEKFKLFTTFADLPKQPTLTFKYFKA
jgi:hypothetical protein